MLRARCKKSSTAATPAQAQKAASLCHCLREALIRRATANRSPNYWERSARPTQTAMHLQKSTSYPSPHVNPRPVGRAYSVNVDRGPLGHLSTKFDRYDVRMHSSGRWNDAPTRRASCKQERFTKYAKKLSKRKLCQWILLRLCQWAAATHLRASDAPRSCTRATLTTLSESGSDQSDVVLEAFND